MNDRHLQAHPAAFSAAHAAQLTFNAEKALWSADTTPLYQRRVATLLYWAGVAEIAAEQSWRAASQQSGDADSVAVHTRAAAQAQYAANVARGVAALPPPPMWREGAPLC